MRVKLGVGDINAAYFIRLAKDGNIFSFQLTDYINFNRKCKRILNRCRLIQLESCATVQFISSKAIANPGIKLSNFRTARSSIFPAVDFSA